jgi:hypothetical protein
MAFPESILDASWLADAQAPASLSLFDEFQA